MKSLKYLFVSLIVTSFTLASPITAATSVFFWNGMTSNDNTTPPSLRKKIADYVDDFSGGTQFDVTFDSSIDPGALARSLSGRNYDVLVLDITDDTIRLNAADIAAVQQFYQSGRQALMLDGSFAIRSLVYNNRTQFPGPNETYGKLTVNQVAAIAARGGGILIAADHDVWQVNTNKIVQALLPGARFKGTTNPSTDGDFIGDELLGMKANAIPKDIFNHWAAVPNQGEAPIGGFTDFLGQAVTLYPLVEASDKPGGKRRRPYISASFDPGDTRTAIDSEEELFENIPTHKSPQ
ncbi:MAG: hypothetical protein AAF198_13570 [Pseudomonadota bacterium]